MPIYIEKEWKWHIWNFIDKFKIKPLIYFGLTIFGIGILKKLTK